MSAIKTGGQCFETANALALTFSARHMDPMIVHALVTHPDKGFRHIHAWVEVGNLVFDYEYQVGFVLPRDIYYKAGEIKGGEIVYYTVYEATEQMLLLGHHGPWDEGLIFKESIPDEFATDCKRLSAG